MKHWYLWLMKHDIGVLRFLYFSPPLALLLPDPRWLWFVVLFDGAVALTFQVGHNHGWDK